MKKIVLTIAFFLSATSYASEVVHLDKCNVDQALNLLERYQGTYGPITSTQLDAAIPVIGADATAFEYIVKYVMSYVWTCAYKTPGAGPVNLTQQRDLNYALRCMPASGSLLVGSFVLWERQCWNELNSSYKSE